MEGYDYTERFILGKYFNLEQGIFLMGEAEQLCSDYFGQGLKISLILSPALNYIQLLSPGFLPKLLPKGT